MTAILRAGKYVARPFALGLGVGVGLSISLGAFQEHIGRFDAVEARRFSVVDDNGNSVAILATPPGKSTPGLILKNAQGAPAAMLVVADDRASLTMFGPDDSAAAVGFEGDIPVFVSRGNGGRVLGTLPTSR